MDLDNHAALVKGAMAAPDLVAVPEAVREEEDRALRVPNHDHSTTAIYHIAVIPVVDCVFQYFLAVY